MTVTPIVLTSDMLLHLVTHPRFILLVCGSSSASGHGWRAYTSPLEPIMSSTRTGHNTQQCMHNTNRWDLHVITEADGGVLALDREEGGQHHVLVRHASLAT